MKVKLVCLDTFAPHGDVRLRDLPATIGRGSDADVQLADRFASRLHCVLEFVADRVIVRDLESANGTLVNGDRIREAPLFPGDRLTVGTTNFRIEYRMKRAGVFALWQRAAVTDSV